MKYLKLLFLVLLFGCSSSPGKFQYTDIYLDYSVKETKKYFFSVLTSLELFLIRNIQNGNDTTNNDIQNILNDFDQYYVLIRKETKNQYLLIFEHYNTSNQPFKRITSDGGYYYWSIKYNKNGFYDLHINGYA